MLAATGLLFVLIANVFLTRKRDRTILNPSLLFNLLWVFITFLTSFRWLDLYPSSTKSYSVIFLGVLFFVIGSHLSIFFENIHIKRYVFTSNTVLRYRILCFCAIICILYYFPNFIRSFIFMMRGSSIGQVRSLIQNSESATGWRNFIPNFVILPIAISLEVLATVDFFFGKAHKGLFVLTAFLILIRVIGDGGRTPVFNLLVYTILSYILIKYDRKNDTGIKINNFTRKKDKKIKSLIAICGAFLIILTFMRSSAILAPTVYRKLYFYFSMSPVLLSYWIDYVDALGWFGYGTISLNGILYFVEYFIKNLLRNVYNEPIKAAYDLIALTDSTWLQIAPPTSANAYVSCFFFFYADGGFFAVILYTLIYGFVFGLMYNRMIVTKDIRKITIYLFLCQGLVFSFIRFQFVKVYFIIAILFIYVIAFKTNFKIID